jgi:hypothetical protein
MDACGIRRAADGVVSAAEHVDVEEFVLGELGDEPIVGYVVDGGAVMEGVGGRNEASVTPVVPACVVGGHGRAIPECRSIEMAEMAHRFLGRSVA